MIDSEDRSQLSIDGIKKATREGKLLFTDHAVRQMAKRSILDTEVREAILSGEIIESYPDDKYSPSCLIYGHTEAGRALHVQCSFPPVVRVITAYEPDPIEWTDNRARKREKP